jgi:excisionase family DNA binding protein
MTDTIDADQCAELLLCTSQQVEELARGGDLPALKIGRRWLFVRADLLSYLAEKGRADAQERRSQRSLGATPLLIKPRRGSPPLLGFR